MTPWLSNLVRFCKHNDDAKRQRVTAILDKLITMTINEKQMYPSIQAKIWGSLGQVLSFLKYLSSTSLVQIFIWYPHCAKHCARDIAIEKTVPFFKKHARHPPNPWSTSELQESVSQNQRKTNYSSTLLHSIITVTPQSPWCAEPTGVEGQLYYAIFM